MHAFAAVAAAAVAAASAHPVVKPHSGHRLTKFAVHFTPPEDAGHEGLTETTYDVHVEPPRGSRARCRAAEDPPTTALAAAGSTVKQRLPRPPHGWCAGRYSVRVQMTRGPYCAPGQPCAAFPTQTTSTGTTHFTVKRR